MKLTLTKILLCSVLLIASCNSKNDNIEFDSVTWKNDKNGCQGLRKNLKEDFLIIKKFVIKKSEQEVIGLLGKPDIQQLDNRSKKSYIYYIDPSPDCDGALERPQKLVIEFNSINQVRFATFQKW